MENVIKIVEVLSYFIAMSVAIMFMVGLINCRRMVKIVILALFVYLIASLAQAEPKIPYTLHDTWEEGNDWAPDQVWFEPSKDTGHFGSIIHHNYDTTSLDLGDHTLSIETTEGTVTVVLTVTQNSACKPGCPDTLEIYDLPDDVVAETFSITTPETHIKSIRLYKYTGA